MAVRIFNVLILAREGAGAGSDARPSIIYQNDRLLATSGADARAQVRAAIDEEHGVGVYRDEQMAKAITEYTLTPF